MSGFVTSGIEDALSSGRCVSSWIFGPAATVVQRSIISVFPPMKEAQDEAYKVLHTTYLPRLPSLHTKTSIAVMWTNLPVQRSPYWTPNHFVLLDTAPSSRQPPSSHPTNAESTRRQPPSSQPTNAESTRRQPPSSQPTNAESTRRQPPSSQPTNAESTRRQPPSSQPTNAESTYENRRQVSRLTKPHNDQPTSLEKWIHVHEEESKTNRIQWECSNKTAFHCRGAVTTIIGVRFLVV